MSNQKSRSNGVVEKREAAMPEVKKLVRKYGRQAVGWCVNQLAEYERKMKKLEQAKAEVRAMERELEA